MSGTNKWTIENTPPSQSGTLLRSDIRPVGSHFSPESGINRMSKADIPQDGLPALNIRSRSISLLKDSLRDFGIDEHEHGGLQDSSEGVISLVWKLVSECQQGVRQVQLTRESLARIENENKLLKTRVTRLTDDLARIKAEHKERENDFRRKEGVLQSKLDELSKNRFEWEKTALTYKGREKKFVAERKKQESEYERLQDRMRRSLSINSRPRFSPPLSDSVSFSIDQIPPLAPARDEWVPRLNFR